MNKNLITLALALSLSACGSDSVTEDAKKVIEDLTNTPATFDGTATASINSGSEAISNSVMVKDDDEGEAVFAEQTATSTTYGTFSIAANGAWTYEVDTANADIIALASASDTVTDTIEIASADGTTSSIVITIAGVNPQGTDDNSEPTFSGDQTGGLLNNATMPATGTLTVVDDDADESAATAATVDGTYGTLTIDAAGAWSYMQDTANSAVSGLAELAMLKDTIAVTSADGTATSIVITITGAATTVTVPSNNAATFSGDETGAVNSDATAATTGTLTVSDVDAGEDAATAATVTGTYGSLTIDAAGAWSYTLDTSKNEVMTLAENAVLTDTIAVTSADGTASSIVITVTGVAAASSSNASFSGELSASTVSRSIEPLRGDITVTDADDGENLIIEQDEVNTAYGVFTIEEDGGWEYTVDNTKDASFLLMAGEPALVDTIEIESADGSTDNLVITIEGYEALDTNPVAGDDSVPAVNCTTTVSSISQLEDGLDDLEAGDTLCLADGEYDEEFNIGFTGEGTAAQPITIAAQTPGGVTIKGSEVSISLGGTYVVLQGFIFRDGERTSTIIKLKDDSVCSYCRITEVSIIDMDGGDFGNSNWIDYYGHHNRIDHNWISGKETKGVMLKLGRWAPSDGEYYPEDYAQIDHNYFGDRAPAWGRAYAGSSDNEYEGIRLGLSFTHATPSNSIVENNYFERIQGEAEIISNKSGNNTIRNNTIHDSNGSIVTRHGEAADISNNFIFGDDNPFAGGIRLVDGEHTVTNNYIEGARFLSSNWNGGIVLTAGNGSGDGENGYQDVENVLIAHNTIVDSVNSLNVFGGKESTRPDNVYFVNNIIADAIGPVLRTNNEDMPTNTTFDGNYVYGASFSDDDSVSSVPGLAFSDPELDNSTDGLYRPTGSVTLDAAIVDTGDFDLPTIDMDGQTRTDDDTTSGADETLTGGETLAPLTSADVGPSYRPAVGKMYVQKVDVANYAFDSGDLTGWVNNGGVITTDSTEVFSRGNSLKLDSDTSDVTQTVTVIANTNYTLSAFMKGAAKLSVTVDGITYDAERNSDSYGFSSVTFNSGVDTTAVITATVDDFVANNAAILNPEFDNGDDDWTVVEGTGIGQVQDSGNSTDGTEGSIKFVWKDTDSGTPHQPYIAQTIDVVANTDYSMSIYNLNKSKSDDSSILFGASTDSDITLTASHIASKDSLYYSDLKDVTEEADDSFHKDTLSFNTGANTSITIFAQFKSSTGTEIRVDEFSLGYEGAPTVTEAYFDDIRLVSMPLSEAESAAEE